MKRIIVIFTLIAAFVLTSMPVLAQTSTVSSTPTIEKAPPVVIDIFYSPTCPHCQIALSHLGTVQDKYGERVEINKYNLFEGIFNDRLEEMYAEYKVPKIRQGSVPAIFIGEEYYVGYDDSIDYDMNYQIEKLLNKQGKDTSTSTPDKFILNTSTPIRDYTKMVVPLIGEINLSSHSPLFLSVVLGTLDGFNACAMVALGFLLAVLVATKNRRRVLIVGGTFIFVSGLVYFMFIAAWLNLLIFLKHATWITTVVGLITILFGGFLLKDYAVGIVCKICNIDPKKKNILGNWQRKLFVKMTEITNANMPLPLMLLGVAVVAAGINTVELFCSFGFPLAFTNYLTTLGLSTSSYSFYLVVYVILYMIDDFIIFLIALATLRMTKMSDKYLRFIMLISGIVLILLGVYMLMKGF